MFLHLYIYIYIYASNYYYYIYIYILFVFTKPESSLTLGRSWGQVATVLALHIATSGSSVAPAAEALLDSTGANPVVTACGLAANWGAGGIKW